MKNSLFNNQNKLTKALFSAAISALISNAVYANDAYGNLFEGEDFVKDDWQLVCDNTLTCRAAGYADDSMLETPASILLTLAPRATLPVGQVQFSPKTLENKQSVEFWLNDKSYGNLSLDADGYSYALTALQTTQLIRNARMSTKIEIKVGSESWTISDKGMSAVLLKLDEIQGRVGTPLALVSKNNTDHQTPKVARPIPVIYKAFAYSDKDNKQLSAAKLEYFQKNINQWININSEQLIGSGQEMGDCKLVNSNTEEFKQMHGSGMLGWQFMPVDENYTLANHICRTNGVNRVGGYWLIDNERPHSPKLITTAGTEYYEGEISAIDKYRYNGGDCWDSKTWTWDGKTFALSEDSSSGMCRGFAGGAWNLPTYVSEVVNTND